MEKYFDGGLPVGINSGQTVNNVMILVAERLRKHLRGFARNDATILPKSFQPDRNKCCELLVLAIFFDERKENTALKCL